MGSIGIDRHTGRVLTDWAHVVQSVADILTTAPLSRVMRRDYGSDVPGLVDMPMTEETLLNLYVAVADALGSWEPRYVVTRVAYTTAGRDGRATLALDGFY